MHRQSRERARQAEGLARRLAEARLQALRMQLQPHFLFNTLNAIASHLREQPDIAEDMIGHLGDFLRRTLDGSLEAKTTLRRELTLLDDYLAIEQVRFGKRLVVRREIAPQTLNCLVPVLLLQPLVENAVRHGIAPRRGSGHIRVTAQSLEGRLRLEVSDDGRGLPDQPLREGVGLTNTRARLQELYGRAAELKVRPANGGGVIATIELPGEAQEPDAAPPVPASFGGVSSSSYEFQRYHRR
jgi:LytS/YehU family sensor histidine kinase